MVGLKHIFCTFSFTMVTGAAIVQGNISSSCIRYGYGDLSSQGLDNSGAMEGTTSGPRDGAQINPLNLASYIAIDSLAFLLERSVGLQSMNTSGNGVELNAKNSSLDYLTIQPCLHPRIAMSIGLLPFFNVGYSVSDTQVITNPITGNMADYVGSHTGGGGLHQLCAGAEVKVLKSPSAGVNASYFWGDINQTRVLYFPNASGAYNYNHQPVASVSSYKFDLGAQYTLNANKKHSVAIRAIYSPELKLGNDYNVTTQMVLNSTGTAVSTTTLKPDVTSGVPNTLGAGLTYNCDKRLTIGLGYSLQQQSKTRFDANTLDEAAREDLNETYAYCNRHEVLMDAEYIPNLMGHSYLSHIRYRLGAYYTTPYYKIGGKEVTREYGVTVGLGLPVPRSRSILSTSGQFVHISEQESAFAGENIFHVSIGLTFNGRRLFKHRAE